MVGTRNSQDRGEAGRSVRSGIWGSPTVVISPKTLFRCIIIRLSGLKFFI